MADSCTHIYKYIYIYAHIHRGREIPGGPESSRKPREIEFTKNLVSADDDNEEDEEEEDDGRRGEATFLNKKYITFRNKAHQPAAGLALATTRRTTTRRTTTRRRTTK